jgi:hypothetical protein
MADAMMQQTEGGYAFLPGSPTGPFSGGALALPGYEIVHAALHTPLPWRQAFALIERHLIRHGRPRAALCGTELRCPEPYTPEGFAAFNREYRALLESWGILVDGYSPAARSNVAPAFAPPKEQSLHAFSYTVPTSEPSASPSFVLSGSAERPEVRPGDTSLDALREKTADILSNMETRLARVGATWADVTAVTVYTARPFQPLLETQILPTLGSAALHGLHRFYCRPPVQNLEIEIDVRGTRQERRIASGTEATPNRP